MKKLPINEGSQEYLKETETLLTEKKSGPKREIHILTISWFFAFQ